MLRFVLRCFGVAGLLVAAFYGWRFSQPYADQANAIFMAVAAVISLVLFWLSSRIRWPGAVSRHWRYAVGFLIVMAMFGYGAIISIQRGEELSRQRAETDASLAKSFNDLRARWGVEERPVKTLKIAPDGTVK